MRVPTNVGTLEMPRAGRARRGTSSRATCRPPERYPQVALLVVELASGTRRLHVAARIALEGSTVVPFHTSAGASVTMRVASAASGR